MKESRIKPFAAADMYEAGKSVAEIAQHFGVSRVALWKAWKRIGYHTNGLRFTKPCAWCGKTVSLQRSRMLKRRSVYCSTRCYMKMIKTRGAGYFEWRHGQRLARAEVSKYFELKPGMVVHHRDENTTNNMLRNLWVFKSQADHMSYHRGGPAVPIWKGYDFLQQRRRPRKPPIEDQPTES
jgi:transposase-like protein